jgi:hypothetical protein
MAGSTTRPATLSSAGRPRATGFLIKEQHTKAARESRLFVPSSDARLKAVALTPMSGQQIGQMRA